MVTLMLDSVTGDDIYASVRMLVALPHRPAIVLLESPADCSCLSPHVDDSTVRLIPCFGAPNLTRAIERVDIDGIQGVLAIRDRDWVGILEPESTSPNLIYTDLYDLDASIALVTNIGTRIIYVFGDLDAIREFCTTNHVSNPLAAVIGMVSELGLLRLVSQRHDLGLPLRGFPLYEVVAASTGTGIRQQLITLALRRSPDCRSSADEVLALMEAEGPQPQRRLCAGYDLAALLAHLIHRAWKGSKPGTQQILQTTRSALSCAELWTLRLYQAVLAWELRTGWSIWKCRPSAF